MGFLLGSYKIIIGFLRDSFGRDAYDIPMGLLQNSSRTPCCLWRSVVIQTVFVERQTRAKKDNANATWRSLVKLSLSFLSSHRLHRCRQRPMENHGLINPDVRCTTQTGIVIHFTMIFGDCINNTT